MKRILNLILLLSAASLSYAQSDRINAARNIDYKIEAENRVIIEFDIESNGIDEIYNVDRLEVEIGNQKLMLVRGTHAISGDIGKVNLGNRRKRIIWNWPRDVTSINGLTRFTVFAYGSVCPPLPKETTDLVIGGALGGLGLGLGVAGLSTILKKNQTDPAADPVKDPIRYYYTFCDPNSADFDDSRVILGEGSDPDRSRCDDHLLEANSKYQSGQTLLGIGAALIAGGAYFVLKKPIFKSAMIKYGKENQDCVMVQPTLDFQLSATQSIMRPVVGVRMTYQFGK